MDERLLELSEIAAELKCRPSEILSRVAQLQQEVRDSKKRITQLMSGAASDVVGDALKQAVDASGYRCAITKLNGVSGKELRGVWDGIRDAAQGKPIACVLASATSDGKVGLLAAGTDAAVAAGFSAGDIVSALAQKLGGRGGGRPNMAQAGGTNVDGIDAALEAARQMIGA